MATVNFSVPDEVKVAFDKAFGDQNKSAVIAELMRRAVAESQLARRRMQIYRKLSANRGAGSTSDPAQWRAAREHGRP
ncbi:MAG: hypothetical protein QM718_05900 [Steroidobacteraceae bacterium]